MPLEGGSGGGVEPAGQALADGVLAVLLDELDIEGGGGGDGIIIGAALLLVASAGITPPPEAACRYSAVAIPVASLMRVLACWIRGEGDP